jgi:hypothetical protein
MKTFLNYAICLSGAALALVSNAATFQWDASWGWYPDQLTPGIGLINESAETPLLTNGALIIATDIPEEHMYYICSDGNLLMPTNLIIEAEARVLSNNDEAEGTRTASCISFTTSQYVGNALYLDVGAIFISDGTDTRGASATVDTTNAFHTYRIEVYGTTVGSTFEVYQDGVFQFTGSLYTSVPDNGDPSVSFGDGSAYASGGAEWLSFQHNAAAASSTVRPNLFIGPPQTLTLQGMPGHSYTIQTVSDLAQTNWTGVTNLALTTNAFGSVNVPMEGSQGFYRAVQSQ